MRQGPNRFLVFPYLCNLIKLHEKTAKPSGQERCVLVEWRNGIKGNVHSIQWNCYYDFDDNMWMDDSMDDRLLPADPFDCWFYYSEIEEFIASLAKDAE